MLTSHLGKRIVGACVMTLWMQSATLQTAHAQFKAKPSDQPTRGWVLPGFPMPEAMPMVPRPEHEHVYRYSMPMVPGPEYQRAQPLPLRQGDGQKHQNSP